MSILTQEHIFQSELLFGDGFQVWREEETNYRVINQQELAKLIRGIKGIIALDVPEALSQSLCCPLSPLQILQSGKKPF